MAAVTSTGASTQSIFADPGAATTTKTTTGSGSDALANTQTFMTLLVAQLKNQDPTSPQDGMQFVSQLAQFSNLEQSVAMRQDIDSIKTKYMATASTTPAGS
jgi:flagellar basal-body rod modification protein FlgD